MISPDLCGEKAGLTRCLWGEGWFHQVFVGRRLVSSGVCEEKAGLTRCLWGEGRFDQVFVVRRLV